MTAVRFGPAFGASMMAAVVSAAAASLIGLVVGLLSVGGAEALVIGAGVFFYGFFVAFAHAIVLGLPIYCLLARRWPLTLGAALAGSVAVAILPFAAFSVWSLGQEFDLSFLAWPVLGLAMCGAPGGLIFWGLMRD